MAGGLSIELRRETEARLRSESYSMRGHILTARLFALSGYYAVDSIREIREQDRRYFLTNIRKG